MVTVYYRSPDLTQLDDPATCSGTNRRAAVHQHVRADLLSIGKAWGYYRHSDKRQDDEDHHSPLPSVWFINAWNFIFTTPYMWQIHEMGLIKFFVGLVVPRVETQTWYLPHKKMYDAYSENKYRFTVKNRVRFRIKFNSCQILRSSNYFSTYSPPLLRHLS